MRSKLGVCKQARVENAFFRCKSIIEAGLRDRNGGGRKVEVSLACSVLNRMTGLDDADSRRKVRSVQAHSRAVRQ